MKAFIYNHSCDRGLKTDLFESLFALDVPLNAVCEALTPYSPAYSSNSICRVMRIKFFCYEFQYAKVNVFLPDRINIPDNCQADEFLRSLLHAELISEDRIRKIWPVPVVRVYIYKNQDTKYLLRWIPFEGGLTAAVAS
uniref:Uncharacterized protein n=1 Tax=Glossina palpalis gambiensis TaxID=67801 RepID=A0A1B0B1Z0_9MUSC